MVQSEPRGERQGTEGSARATFTDQALLYKHAGKTQQDQLRFV